MKKKQLHEFAAPKEKGMEGHINSLRKSGKLKGRKKY
jgi:hypothetical protein